MGRDIVSSFWQFSTSHRRYRERDKERKKKKPLRSRRSRNSRLTLDAERERERAKHFKMQNDLIRVKFFGLKVGIRNQWPAALVGISRRRRRGQRNYRTSSGFRSLEVCVWVNMVNAWSSSRRRTSFSFLDGLSTLSLSLSSLCSARKSAYLLDDDSRTQENIFSLSPQMCVIFLRGKKTRPGKKKNEQNMSGSVLIESASVSIK